MSEYVIPIVTTTLTVIGAGYTVWATQRGAERVSKQQATVPPYEQLVQRMDRVERRNDELAAMNGELQDKLRRLVWHTVAVLDRVDNGASLADMHHDLTALRVAALDATDEPHPPTDRRENTS